MACGYAELHCLSNFSFLRGASHPEELVERAAALGYAALALTDECSLAGVVRAHLAARQTRLKLIVGAEIRLADGPRLVLLAADHNGYGNLAALITRGRRSAAKGSYRLATADLEEGLEGCLALLLPMPGRSEAADSLGAQAEWLKARFPGRCWLAVELHKGPDDRNRLARALEFAACAGLPAVAAGGIHMHVRGRRRLQDVLTCIRLGVTVEGAGGALAPNGERSLRPRAALERIYPAQLLAETLEIAARCRFSLDALRYEYPDELVPAGQTPATWLRRLVEDGLGTRFGVAVPAPVRGQVEHELALIAELAYEPYFLTVHDLVRFARGRGILCQGRGSAANSAVCYALGITEVDPARMSMLFERFVSRERNEPPDIDVDFEHERREEVIQYLYARYGRERAALTASVIAYRPKSALKDVGKALGFDADRLNELTRNLAWWDRGEGLPQRLREAGFDPAQPRVARLIELAGELIGFPRHLSQHTGGFVISRGPLCRLVPIENAAMAERTVIQWDKDDLDALGLLKVDVLALGMLTAVRKALELASGWAARRSPTAKPMTMADIPAEDPAVYDMLCRADSVGVFQVESRAQMAMLPRMRPRRFYDLVIEVAIVRPGPIQGGMVHPYLRRRQGLEPVSYPSEAVRKVLERTLGVPIFQEQVMQLAVVAAGFTPGEADRLRRLMATWRKKGGIEALERRLVEGMLERGYAEEFAQRIYQQILGFGEYGFPESHAASFALLVYVSAWLKRHHPAAFLCALLNAQPMGFYAPSQLIQDARHHGVEVRPAEVTASGWDCALEAAGAPARGSPSPDPAARLGLRMVKGLSEDAALRIAAARAEAAFASVDDLAERAGLDARELGLLAAAGALAGLAGHRRRARWQAAGARPLPRLLRGARIDEPAPMLAAPGEGEDLVADYRALGFSLGRHPLALLRRQLAGLRFVTAAELNGYPDRKLGRTAGVVTCRQRPGTASGVVFLTLEDETGSTNVIVHGDLVERQRRELLGARLMGVFGQVQREGLVVHLVAMRLVDHSALLGRLATRSRDFH
ncbi:MAG TPA: error-prone DNA polymerase [Rhodocyclaceae bacterium]|nr:error-prone DNA polymerase [Rhodocyclaceae bacterium]